MNEQEFATMKEQGKVEEFTPATVPQNPAPQQPDESGIPLSEWEPLLHRLRELLPTLETPTSVGQSIAISTDFSDAARLNTNTASGGTVAVSGVSGGLVISANSTGGGLSQVEWHLTPKTDLGLYQLLPEFTAIVDVNNIAAASGEGDFFCGIGSPAVAATDITFTDHHVGFKILKRSGAVKLYATQADGTTEEELELATLAAGDVLILRFKIIDGAVQYSFRKNPASNAWSAVSSLTANIPTDPIQVCSSATTNRNTAFNFNFVIAAASLNIPLTT